MSTPTEAAEAAARVAAVVAEQRALLAAMETRQRAHVDATYAAMADNLRAMATRLHATARQYGPGGTRLPRDALGARPGGRCPHCRDDACEFFHAPWQPHWPGLRAHRPGEASCVQRVRSAVARLRAPTAAHSGRYTGWAPANAAARPIPVKIGERVGGPSVRVAAARTATGGLVPGGVSLKANLRAR